MQSTVKRFHRRDETATRDGVRARTTAGRLEVVDADGRLLFEYDPDRGGRVRLAEHPVRLEAPSLHFAAEDGICFEADRVEIRGRHRCEVVAGSGPDRARLGLDRGCGRLTAETLELGAGHAQVEFQRATLTGERWQGRLGQAHLVLDRLETVCDTVLETARNSYRKIEELAQTTAGRMKTVVEATYHFRSRRTFMSSKRDFKVNADKIHLG